VMLQDSRTRAPLKWFDQPMALFTCRFVSRFRVGKRE
jgi:hypothetical protein